MKEKSHKPWHHKKPGSDWVYPKVRKGDRRQSRAGAMKGMTAALAAMREFLS